LAAPVDQVGGVQPLAAQQRADLARLGAGVGLAEDGQLVSALKRRRLAFSGSSGSGGPDIPPGSTLVRGAVIVTVMSWEYSLSPHQ
jgi:hypothetical protein